MRHDGAPLPNKTDLLAAIAIVADNQQHNLFGDVVRSFSSSTRRALTPVARRPPLLNLLGTALLADMIVAMNEKSGTDKEPLSLILHLGDATDTPCTGEFEDFLEAMRESSGKVGAFWIYAPGNHDAFLAGNTIWMPPGGTKWWSNPEPPRGLTPAPTGGGNSWNRACWDPSRSSVAMNKRLLICRYLSATFPKPMEELCPPTAASPCSACRPLSATRALGEWTHEVWGEAHDFDTGDGGQGPWKSWIIQRVRKAKAKLTIIILDTVDTPTSPYLHLVSTHGTLGVRQSERLALWSKEARDMGDLVIVAGHHPLSQMDADPRNAIVNAADVYLSAHTHLANALLLHSAGQSRFPEINVGSVVDWPMDGLKLRIWASPAGGESVDWTTYSYSFSEDGRATPPPKSAERRQRSSPNVPDSGVEIYQDLADGAVSRLHVPETRLQSWLGAETMARDLWDGCSYGSLLWPVLCKGAHRRSFLDFKPDWLAEAIADSKSVKDDWAVLDKVTADPTQDQTFETAWLEISAPLRRPPTSRPQPQELPPIEPPKPDAQAVPPPAADGKRKARLKQQPQTPRPIELQQNNPPRRLPAGEQPPPSQDNGGQAEQIQQRH